MEGTLRKHLFFLLCLFVPAFVFAQPIANFSSNIQSGCAPLIVNFQDLSTGGATEWKWDLGNGSSSTAQNPSATYFLPGTYSVVLTASNAGGSNSLTRTAYITIYDKPKPDFNASSTSGCYPFVVKFDDASAASNGTVNTDWQWDFGNGTTGTSASTQGLFTAVGDYTISLKVTNDKGCFASVSKPAFIHVPTGIQMGFDNTTVDRCQTPFPITFNSTTTGPGTLSYAWNFGDGGTGTGSSATHNYTTSGSYSVSLIVTSTSGCSDTLTKQNLLSIDNVKTTFQSPDSICTQAPASFTNTSAPLPLSSRWVFGDGTSATAIDAVKTFNTAGNYTVQLFNTYAYCTDTVSKVVRALPRPVASFTADQTFQCKPPLAVTFSSGAPNAAGWFWDFGDGQTSTLPNPVHTYTAFGDFDVLLVVTSPSGCVDTLRKPAYIKIRKPVISFPTLPITGCIPYNASFSAAVNTLDNVLTYLWDLGDGTTSTLSTPTHLYPTQGGYPVSLTVTTSTGCTETASVSNGVLVGRTPVIDFTVSATSNCAFQDVRFNGTTNEGTQWQWNFGDGTSSSIQNPVHAYAATGTFDVTLSVTNSGCTKRLTRPALITVKPPIAKYSVQKNCGNPLQYFFTDNSVGAQTWSWTFGDGGTSTGQNPSHVFPGEGNYTVRLTVTNGSCSHAFDTTVTVHDESPSIEADIREACKTATVYYRAIMKNSNYFVGFSWTFGNGQYNFAANPPVDYTTAGDYSTTLITTDIYGCKDTAFQSNYIRINGPTANFSVQNNSGCKGLDAAFTDLSTTDGRHPITKWTWQFGDGLADSVSSNAVVQHVYNQTGNFSPQLVVTDAAGCQDSLRLTDLVKTTAPKILFSSPDTLTCLGSSVQFYNETALTSMTSEWFFGDGSGSLLNNPNHLYSDTGAYAVSLKVTDATGCSDSVGINNFVTIKRTIASFAVSDSVGGCTPFKVDLTNTSNFYESSTWDFGNSMSTAPNPSTTYQQAGTYTVTLAVKGRGGCTDTTQRSVVIFSDSLIKFSYSPLEGCNSVFLSTSVSSPTKMTYSWDFGDGALVTTKDNNTTHLYTTAGNYTPRLIVTDSGNCVLPFFGIDTVRVKGIVAKFGWDRRLLCDSGRVQFIDSTKSTETIRVYNWNFGDGQTSALQSPAHHYQRPGIYTVSLQTETESACRDTMTLQTLIKVVQSPSIRILSDSVLCRDGTMLHAGVYLRADTSAVQWYWNFPNGNSAVGFNPPPQRYATTGDFFVSAVAVNSSGCTDTAVQKLTVLPLPALTVPPALTTMVGTPITIQPVTYSPNVAVFEWTPDTGLSCTDCPQPAAKPKFNTTYHLAVTDSNGCRNTASVAVVVFCQNANVFVPNTFSPNGDGSNDVFYVRGSGISRVKTLRIFNRLGEVIFERFNFGVNDETAGWDGTYKGVRQAPGTFIYQVDVFCDNNDTIRFDGSITLIR